MKSVVFDTNVLLDIFVFHDLRAIHLKEALLNQTLDTLASEKTLEELTDVIARPLFSLSQSEQKRITLEWRSLARIIKDEDIVKAPWECHDKDDQVFLDLAYTAKPCVLISKDNEVLKLANRAVKEGVVITADYKAL
ncbi:putative toxin-antitoxin system toxin component, PIN family [Polynucleobacter sp.]|uniref:putative toxin-antitoxin system toxin component, PIN family n=1 Tax=Polynucleobacter sp. TaxID=2029855 RepID=UPI0033401882